MPLRFQSLQVVSVRPDFETATKYGAYWTLRYLNQPAEAAGVGVVDLNKEACTKENFDDAILNKNAVMVGGCGHGNQTTFTGQNYDELLNTGSGSDAELLRGRGGSFLSCEFGASAEHWINWGMKGFYGYDETVYIPASSFPNHDAELLFKAHYAFDGALLVGKTWGEAWDDSDDVWIACMKQATPYGQRILLYDYEIRVRAGDDNFKPYVEPPPPPDDIVCPWLDFEGTPLEVQNHVKTTHAKYLVEPCIIPQPWREWLKCKIP